LWRSRPDGGERLQLTAPDFHASAPNWSPDNTWIAFEAKPPGQLPGVYAIPLAGGSPERITPAQFAEGVPSFSADGKSLLLQRYLFPGASGQPGIYIMDWKTRTRDLVPGSESMLWPVWSPDARYIAANRAGTEVWLCDLRTKRWNLLATGNGIGTVFWSRDSKYVYYQEAFGDVEEPVVRVRISNRKVERVAGMAQIPQSNLAGYRLAGLAPDDAPIASIIHSNSDIYAMDVDLP
jgi:Tol biopolymer transport system component